jgi:squalene synthase HpnC
MMPTALLELSPAEIPNAQAVMDRAAHESFPVAARVLSRRDRRHLLAVYGFARLADELGDELSGDRLAALDWLEGELERAYAGHARHPLLAGMQDTLVECSLPREPLARLIEANRLDQRQTRYETWAQLQAYCELSANPVGEVVLHVFGLATHERVALSNDVCTALQLAEHLQDVGEDLRRGRIYLPAEDLVRFGCSHGQLAHLVSGGVSDLDLDGDLGGSSGPFDGVAGAAERLAETVEFEVGRARELLAVGVQLVASVDGRPKLAMAAFVAGGRAALGEIERARFQVLGGVRRASRVSRLRALASVLGESRA